MGRIVAIGGLESSRIFRYICEMSHKEKPNFLFIATPSSDDGALYAKISMQVGEFGCEPRPLYLFRRKYSKAQLDEIFSWADIIYVCGGDTFKSIEAWKKFGIDEYLRGVFLRDSAILCGSSAGGICWFKRGMSDSSRTPEYGKHGWVDGIGIFPDLCFCPHFSGRGEVFRQALCDSGEEGIGVDNNAAYVYDNGKESFISCSSTCKLGIFRQQDGNLTITVPEAEILSE